VNTKDDPTKLVRQDAILGGLSIGQFHDKCPGEWPGEPLSGVTIIWGNNCPGGKMMGELLFAPAKFMGELLSGGNFCLYPVLLLF